MRVLIACGDAAVRDAFVEALRQAGISVVPAPPDVTATLKLARRHRPDVVLLDDALPAVSGVAGLGQLAAELPEAQLVILAARYEQSAGLDALVAGAAGYLSRGTPPEALPRVVRGLLRGETATPRTLTLALVERLRALAASELGSRPVKSLLTAREWEVLDLLTAGASTREISDELVVSLETVHSHVKHILHKLGVHSRAEAIATAHALRSQRPGSAGTG